VLDLLAMAALSAFLLPGGGDSRFLARRHGLLVLIAYLVYLSTRLIV
jgi:hypothetical protein